MKNGLKIGLVAFVCALVGAMAGVGIYAGVSTASSKQMVEQTKLNKDVAEAANVFNQPRMTNAVYALGDVPSDFVEAANRSINGVVNIRTEAEVQRQRMISPLEFFFGIPQDPQGEPEGKAPVRVGIGSGVIISTDGYIITNNHVIAGASRITVTTNNNESYEATIIGTDPATDIALIKIDAEGLSPIPFGNSDELQVGEWVLAVGNPFNFSSTVTAGIVSAKGRESRGGDLQIASFIQTDAAVNPGNSGGALVNTRGELVGINTMIYSQTGNYAGYSFAVPVSIASKVVADIKQYGAVQRAVLGVMGRSVDEELRKQYDLTVNEGAVVAGFSDNSAAKDAGIEEGDVIVNINGIKIRSMAMLQEQISKYRPGDVITVGVNRKGKTQTFKVELKNNEGTTDVVQGDKVDFSSLGAKFEPISQETAARLGISHGVVVTEVQRNSKFDEAGIKKGFVIVNINNSRVRNGEDIDRIVKDVIDNAADKVLFIKGVLPNGLVRYRVVDLTS